MQTLKEKQLLLIGKIIVVIFFTFFSLQTYSQSLPKVSFNNYDDQGRKNGYWKDNIERDIYIHYYHNKKMGLSFHLIGNFYSIWDCTSEGISIFGLTFLNDKLIDIYSTKYPNKLVVKIDLDDGTVKEDTPLYSSYVYYFNSKGGLSEECLKLWWEDGPFSDIGNYYGETILYDSLSRYVGINRKDGELFFSEETFYSKEDLKDTNYYRMPQMYDKMNAFRVNNISDSITALYYLKKKKKNGYYRHFNNITKHYSIIGEYKKDNPVGIWLFFDQTSGKLSSIIYNISKNRNIKIVKKNGQRHKYKYKGYMFCLDRESYLKRHGWVLFDDITSDNIFKYSRWIEYGDNIKDLRGVTIYDKREDEMIFYDKESLNIDSNFYPPLYKID